MISSLSVGRPSNLQLQSRPWQMLPGSPCWETDEACDSSRPLVSVCVMRGSMAVWWRKLSFWYILDWKVSLPSCACVYGHKALGMLCWQMDLLHCRATLAKRGRTKRRWERRGRTEVSQA